MCFATTVMECLESLDNKQAVVRPDTPALRVVSAMQETLEQDVVP